MKTTRTGLLLLLSVILLSSTCSKEKECRLLVIDNKTDKIIRYHYSFDYPDTSINFQSFLVDENWGYLGPQQKTNSKSSGGGPCLEDYFKTYALQRISVFVFDADVLGTTPWEQIRQNYQVLKRFDLTLDDLINNNYQIELR